MVGIGWRFGEGTNCGVVGGLKPGGKGEEG